MLRSSPSTNSDSGCQLHIALCQTDIAWEQPARNLARLEPLVAGADADVVVLPELFATGFTLDPAPVAEAPGGEVVTALRRWAVQYGKAVAGSVAVAEGGRFFNRMIFRDARRRVRPL